MSSIIENPPWREKVLDPDETMGRAYRNYLQTLETRSNAAPQILQEVGLQTQTASIVTTPITLPALSAGFYRVSVYAVITVVAAVNSALQVVISWTDNGNPSTQSTVILATNGLGDTISTAFPIHVDNNSPISYSVNYASNVANQMTYNLGVIVEALA